MFTKKNFLFLITALFVANKCFAIGDSHEISLNELYFIFDLSCGISALAILLSIFSYFSGSKAVNIIAWILAVISFLTSQVLMHTEYYPLSLVIPFLSLTILLSKMGKNKTGNGFLVVSLLKTITSTLVFFNGCKMILELILPDFLATHTYAYQGFLVLFFNVVLGSMLFRLLVRSEKKRASVRRFYQPILWSVLIGACAYFINILYMILLSYTHRYHIEMSSLLFQVPYLNIFINLLCWIVTGLLVYLFYNLKHKGAIKQRLLK